MLVWLTLPFYDFCGFRSVAVNSVYKLQFFTFIGLGVSILWGVENCHFPLTKPVAVNTGLTLPRSLWKRLAINERNRNGKTLLFPERCYFLPTPSPRKQLLMQIIKRIRQVRDFEFQVAFSASTLLITSASVTCKVAQNKLGAWHH